jgi:hypothetical protein
MKPKKQPPYFIQQLILGAAIGAIAGIVYLINQFIQ